MKITKKRSNLPAGLFATGLLLVSATSASVSASQYKHVAVVPQQIEQQRLPQAKSKGIFSHSTMLPVYASQAKAVANTADLEINQTIYFDGKGDSPLLYLGPDAADWRLTLIDPNGHTDFSEGSSTEKQLRVEKIAVGSESFKGKQVIMTSPSVGSWQVRLTRQATKDQAPAALTKNTGEKAPAGLLPQGYLMFKGDPEFQLYTYLDNNFTVQKSRLNIVAYSLDAAQIAGKRRTMQRQKAQPGTIEKAWVDITSPSNHTTRIVLHDDGLDGDATAGDGLFSAALPTDEIGVYTSQVQVQGTRPDGVKYSRTTTDLYPIARPLFEFSGNAAIVSQSGKNSALVTVPVNQLNPAERVFMAAEVWGVDAKGKAQPVNWIGGIVEPSHSAQGSQLQLAMDLRWFQRNNLRAPYSLKNLRLQTVEDNVPLTELDNLPLLTPALSGLQSIQATGPARTQLISDDMLSIEAPGEDRAVFTQLSGELQTAAAGNKLMLVHGYCSGSVWDTAQFTNSVEFKDYNQNRSHDDFARKIRDFGAAYASFGIVAHSQGGAAALHLYAKYISGLDSASGGRLIQSVGTPYQGTALAGNAAVLGQIFGVGCGKNTDLTYSGSANWLSTIPGWARAQLDYYTTSFKDRWWAYDYCHLATDLLLNDPEDGTTEKWSGQLSGAVNKGHKTGWCHTTGMRDPAQYKDSSRNSSMSSRAAR